MIYSITQEFMVLRDGAAVHHKDVGSTVELSEVEAAELLAAGKVLPRATVTVDGVDAGPPQAGSHPDDGEPGEAVLVEGASVPEGDVEATPGVDVAEVPKPRARRKSAASDSND